MEKRILNNKIGIQIVLLITGVALIIFGILFSLLQSGNFDGTGIIHKLDNEQTRVYGFFIDGFSGFDTFCILIGFATSFVGLALVIASSIKMANYVIIKKSMYSNNVADKNDAPVNAVSTDEISDDNDEQCEEL